MRMKIIISLLVMLVLLAFSPKPKKRAAKPAKAVELVPNNHEPLQPFSMADQHQFD